MEVAVDGDDFLFSSRRRHTRCALVLEFRRVLVRSLNGAPLAAGQIRGAHILWDGLLDVNDPDCPYPKDANGEDVPRDARGKPILNNEVPDPSCHYNQYKFDQSKDDKPRIVPDW